jgi:hypothetical protein
MLFRPVQALLSVCLISVSSLLSWSNIPGVCFSDHNTSVKCFADTTEAESVDPLMIGVLAQSLQTLAAPPLLVIGITLGSIAAFFQISLMFPVVFNWRHARNLHVTCTIVALGASFFLFLTVLNTRFTINGALYGVSTVSLQLVALTRGVLSEVFLWIASMAWFLAFLLQWWVRWWEILERRQQKAKALAEEAAAVAARQRARQR